MSEMTWQRANIRSDESGHWTHGSALPSTAKRPRR